MVIKEDHSTRWKQLFQTAFLSSGVGAGNVHFLDAASVIYISAKQYIRVCSAVSRLQDTPIFMQKHKFLMHQCFMPFLTFACFLRDRCVVHLDIAKHIKERKTHNVETNPALLKFRDHSLFLAYLFGRTLPISSWKNTQTFVKGKTKTWVALLINVCHNNLEHHSEQKRFAMLRRYTQVKDLSKVDKKLPHVKCQQLPRVTTKSIVPYPLVTTEEIHELIRVYLLIKEYFTNK